jgi:hypothetical protein
MPVTSMVKLARIDLQTTDPEKLRVAVKLPHVLQTRAEGTVLRLTVRLANGAFEARNFALRAVGESEALAAEREGGTEVCTFALAARDVGELRMFRAALIQKQRGGTGGSLTIAVQPDACRTAPLPDGPVLFSTYLKTAETGGYVLLARDVDLRKLDPGLDIGAKVPAC